MATQRVLVTGAAGRLVSGIARKLIDRGVDVVGECLLLCGMFALRPTPLQRNRHCERHSRMGEAGRLRVLPRNRLDGPACCSADLHGKYHTLCSRCSTSRVFAPSDCDEAPLLLHLHVKFRVTSVNIEAMFTILILQTCRGGATPRRREPWRPSRSGIGAKWAYFPSDAS